MGHAIKIAIVSAPFLDIFYGRDPKISDPTGPGPTKFGKSRTKSDRSVLGPSGSWIPELAPY